MEKRTILIFIGLYFIATEAKLQLQQAVVISRHGSRTLLRKDHKTFEEEFDSQLTVRGMDQMFRAGSYVRSRYQNLSFLSGVYSSQDIYVRSSDYSRTLNSALSFLLGLYPPRNQTLTTSYAGVFSAPYDIQQVPIHTIAVNTDQLLRGWLQCHALQKRLAEFYESEEFHKAEEESEKFRKTLQGILGIAKIELKDFYNVYDYIHLHHVYNHTDLNITDKQWKKVVALANWVEYNKYSKKIIGDIGGGLLANEIASSFRNVEEKRSTTKLLYYSAHYPTMFSLFTALGLNTSPDTPLRRIPYYASLVFIELLRDSDDDKKLFVQFSFKNGFEEPLKTYSIPGCKDPCALDQFTGLVKSLKVYDVKSWNLACSNSEHSHHLTVGHSDGDEHECPRPKLTGTGGFFLGAFVTLLSVILISGLWHFYLRKRCYPGRMENRPAVGLSDLENTPDSAGVI